MDPEQDVKIIDKLLEMIKCEGEFDEVCVHPCTY